MDVTLREITMDNLFECIRLDVAEDQKGIVESNVFSLAEAKADAERLHASFGFERTGEIEDGEIVVRMKLTGQTS